MLFDDTSGDVQAQPHPGEASVVDIAGAMEAFEHQRLISSWGYRCRSLAH